jgi:hypothetical protein
MQSPQNRGRFRAAHLLLRVAAMRAPTVNLGRGIVSMCISLGFLACDPAGPAASGTVALGSAIDATKFQWLEVRAFPDKGGEFDPKGALVTPSPPWRTGDSVTTVQFPFAYRVGEALGTTPSPDWRLVAWLSRRTSNVDSIDKGDVFCTSTFSIGACGSQFGDYCGVSSGVNCTLDAIAP